MSKILNNVMSSVSKVYEIGLSADANFDFNTFIDGSNWDFSVQTFANNETAISISKDGVCVCAYAPITILNTNLLYYSEHKTGAFFLYSNDSTLKTPTYENLGNEVRLYYGYF